MTTADLHKILDDENRKLSLDELKQVIYELKQDCFKEFGKSLETKTQNRQGIRNIGFYDGEQNAFQICLDLLEHLQDQEKVMNRICFDLGQLSYDLRPAQQGYEVNKVLQKYGYAFEVMHPCPKCSGKITLTRLGASQTWIAFCTDCGHQETIISKDEDAVMDEWNKVFEVRNNAND